MSLPKGLVPGVAREWIRKALNAGGWEIRPKSHLGRGCNCGVCKPVSGCTMTDHGRVLGLHRAVQYVCRAGIKGDLVECGVWLGGSSMRMALTLLEHGESDRTIWMYDTYTGMTAPTPEDNRVSSGEHASIWFDEFKTSKDTSTWCLGPKETVRANMQKTGYPMDKVRMVEGRVEDTLPKEAPEQIALLRLDTDWYSSTKIELETLLPKLSPGGVLIVDDYDFWTGSQKATDDYLEAHHKTLLLTPVGGGAAFAIVP